MSREIKFRAWDTKNKKFITSEKYEASFTLAADGSGLSGVPYSWIGSEDPKYFIISQYTGLKDKNGKEVYEGDILRCNSWIGHDQRKLHNNFVDFYAGETYCGFRIGNNKFRKRLTWNLIYNTEAVVIGNIHQNPELLKGGEQNG